jgi:ubiquitin-conjugating enzyme E2 D/E
MEPAVGALYMKDRSAFEDIARSWTWRYAMHDAISPV